MVDASTSLYNYNIIVQYRDTLLSKTSSLEGVAGPYAGEKSSTIHNSTKVPGPVVPARPGTTELSPSATLIAERLGFTQAGAGAGIRHPVPASVFTPAWDKDGRSGVVARGRAPAALYVQSSPRCPYSKETHVIEEMGVYYCAAGLPGGSGW